jgi:hypothetical protein
VEKSAEAQKDSAKEKMKLALKIAAGIFLGVFAVIGVLATLRWYGQKQRSSKDDFDKQIMALTPVQLIALCGKPDSDTTGALQRTLTYYRSGVPHKPLFESKAIFQSNMLADVSLGPSEWKMADVHEADQWIADIEIAFPCVMQTKKVLEMYRNSQKAR